MAQTISKFAVLTSGDNKRLGICLIKKRSAGNKTANIQLNNLGIYLQRSSR
jgi:hypothetical protein